MCEILPTLYQQFIHLSRYSRWVHEEGRRENWKETVDRYIDYMCDKQCEGKIDADTKDTLRQHVLDLESMPSMRALMTAGPALTRDNVAGFNCSYISINDVRAFDELMYILMCGTGVGYSVERQEVRQLPVISEKFHRSKTCIKVDDSKLGWASAFKELLAMLYQGRIPEWDVSEVRKAGAILKTFGGRASGPEPLVDLFKFSVNMFKNAAGRKLTSEECHDLCCKIAEIVVVGGVRRSACISLSNLSDDRMRHAKSGEWWHDHPYRALSNNSAVYTERPSIGTFMREWTSLYESKSGERGIFNREAAVNKMAEYGRREPGDHNIGTNPCSEIILRSCQFCNLSEVVVRPEDTLETLKDKVKYATILGTMQSTLTDFRYLRDVWKQNTEEEALLGVSLTGVFDNELMNGRNGRETLIEALEILRQVAVDTNKEFAKKLGINPAGAITCVKPSGTVSQLVNSSSGIHARHSEYFIRRVRADRKDPLSMFMLAQNIPCEECVIKPESTWVFSFPMKSPEGAVVKDHLSAVRHLDISNVYNRHWCEHKVSVTIEVKEPEWMDVGAWVYRHFDELAGASFLPSSGNHSYRQLPYEECTKEEYETLLGEMPKDIDWSALSELEDTDMTAGAQTIACSGTSCETVDIEEK